MAKSRIVARILENPTVYRLWQAPFVEQKLAAFRRTNDVAAMRRVLDVGCGPGTNAPIFAHAEYLGVDINPSYCERARRRYGREFIVADVVEYEPPADVRYDAIFLNSFLHHVDDAGTKRILSRLGRLLSPDGHVHIIDLVLPSDRWIARFLALRDRGEYPRPLERWREIFSEFFEIEEFEAFPLTMFGLTLWIHLYFKGVPRR